MIFINRYKKGLSQLFSSAAKRLNRAFPHSLSDKAGQVFVQQFCTGDVIIKFDVKALRDLRLAESDKNRQGYVMDIKLSSKDDDCIIHSIELSNLNKIEKTFFELITGKTWTLNAVLRSSQAHILYTGTTFFRIKPGQTTMVNVLLDPAYSNLMAEFSPECNDASRFVLKVDDKEIIEIENHRNTGQINKLLLEYRHLEASAAGKPHEIELEVFGNSSLLYTGKKQVSVVAGRTSTFNIPLHWAGPSSILRNNREISAFSQVVIQSA